MFVYIPPESSNKLKSLFEKVEEIKENRAEKIMIIGDLNARIGSFENPDPNAISDSSYEPRRCTKNPIKNNQSKLFIKEILKLDLTILNGDTASDPAGEMTFTNHIGQSVIDLCFTTYNIKHLYELYESVDIYIQIISP